MSVSKENAERLNADFIRYIEARFPQWIQYIRVLPDEQAKQDYVELTISDPPGVVHGKPLQLTTWGEEVTVSFGGQHCHFPWPNAYDGSDNREHVAQYLQALMNEDIVIASVWAGGRMKLASDSKPEDIRKFPRAETSNHELRITSWRGTFNDAFPVDWQMYLKASST